VYPRPVPEPLPVWVAVGGNANSGVRAATLGMPLAVAIIGGEPRRFAPLVELYREAGRRAGHDPARLRVSINSPSYVADTAEQAAEEYFPSYAALFTQIGRERGWGPMTREQFDILRSPTGALILGSPQDMIDKILYEYELFHHDRFLAQFSVGTMPHAQIMHAIELLGTRVAPAVRKALSANGA
jgi:alkanesulfonate monooxygenase SsuD/methylene tetrahydromethanopterin reductase-like flavin-dependent oxidoreductase (luciferase family)